MSEYGFEIGMKDFQKLEMQKVRKVLNKYQMTKNDRSIIEDVLKQAYYEWCQSNASACMTEEALKQLLDKDTFAKFTQIALAFHISGMNDKVKETFAFFDEG